MQHELRRSRLVAGREVELDRFPLIPEVADPADLLALVHQLAAARTGGLGDDVEDDGQESARVVRCGKRFTHERKPLPGIAGAGNRRAAAVAPASARTSGVPGRGAAKREEQHQCRGARQERQDEERPVDLDQRARDRSGNRNDGRRCPAQDWDIIPPRCRS